jgi:NAD(P)H-dependent FMN reductase
MTVLSICGSLKPGSTTRLALDVALRGAAVAGATTAVVEIGGLPSCDGREGAYGAEVEAFRGAVTGADALLIGSPEYHGSFSGVLKNALDLLDERHLGGKMVGLVAVAKGDAGAMNTLNHLRHVARWVNAWVLPQQVSIPRAMEAFSEGRVVREGLEGELIALGREVVRYGKLLRG